MRDRVPDFSPLHYHQWIKAPQNIEDRADLTSFPLNELNGLLVGSIRYMHDIDVFKRLIAAGADIHAAQAIFHALREEYPDYVELLLELGVDPNEPSDNWGTPLNLAAYGVDTANVRVLIKAGADVNRPDADGVTPLVAVTQGLAGRLKRVEHCKLTRQQKDNLIDQWTKIASEMTDALKSAGATV